MTASTNTAKVQVYVHDSGQKYNWAFSLSAVAADRQRWIEDALQYNNMPLAAIGRVMCVSLDEIDATDIYVG